MNGIAASTDAEAPVFPALPAERSVLRGTPSTPPPLQLRAENSQHRLNSWYAFALMTTLVVAVIPLGSNRPAFWAIWGGVVGLMGLGYVAGLKLLGGAPRVGLRQFWPEALLLLGLCLYLVFQILPIGQWLPQSILAQDGTRIVVNTFSFDPGSTWLELVQFASFGLLFFLVAQVAANRRRARRLLLVLLVIIAGFAGYGLLSLTQLGDTLLGFEKQAYVGFATGTFVNRNSFATFLASGLALGAPQLLEVLTDRSRQTLPARLVRGGAIFFCVVVILAALFATGSRMGALAAALGVVIPAVLALRRTSRAGAVILIGGFAAAVILIGIYGTGLLERLVFTRGLDQGRVDLHRQVWAAILERPWFGYGGGSFASVFPVFQQPSPLGDRIWDYAHSTYLALWFELGLVAGSIPVAIVALLVARTLGALKEKSNTIISLATIGVAVVFAAHSVIDFSAEIEANAFLLIVVLALGATGRGGRSSPDNGPDRGGS